MKKDIWFPHNEIIAELNFQIFARTNPIHGVREARIALSRIREVLKLSDGTTKTLNNSPTLSYLREHELNHISEVIDKHGRHYFGGQLYMGTDTLDGGMIVAYQQPKFAPPEANFRSYLAPGRSNLLNLSTQDIKEAFSAYLSKRQSFNGGYPKHFR